MRLFLCFLTFIQVKSLAYNLCVVGASSGLGKELVYQTSLDRNKTVLALTTGSVIRAPCRVNSFTEIKNQPVYVSKKVTKDNYWNNLSSFDYENIIFTTSAKPFKEDYSDRLMCKILQDLPKSCKTVTLVSAHGVGDSLSSKEVGIKVMNDWYLKDVYRVKNEQEKMLNFNMFSVKYPKLKRYIIRPKALSYGKTVLNSVTREDLANRILDNLFTEEGLIDLI